MNDLLNSWCDLLKVNDQAEMLSYLSMDMYGYDYLGSGVDILIDDECPKVRHKYRNEAIAKFKSSIGYEFIESDFEYGEVVVIFQMNEKFYKTTYDEDSHRGPNFKYIVDSLQEVKQKTKTVTYYEI